MRQRSRHKRHKRRKQLRRVVLSLGLLLFFAIAILEYGYNIEPYWLQVKEVPLTLPRLAPEFDGYRIVQLSDLHIVDEMPEPFLERILRETNQQNPDLIAITGDIVTKNPQEHASRIEAALSQLEAPTVAVLGNHDHWSDPVKVRQILNNSQVLDIGNDVYNVYRESAQLHIAGVDDVWAAADDLDLVFSKLPQEGAAILLAHEPDFADTVVKTHRFDLQLSGHSHGGQVTLPFLFAPVLPPYAKRYPMGQYQIDDLIQYTNRGIGMVYPRARFGSRPEITVFQLFSKTHAAG